LSGAASSRKPPFELETPEIKAPIEVPTRGGERNEVESLQALSGRKFEEMEVLHRAQEYDLFAGKGAPLATWKLRL